MKDIKKQCGNCLSWNHGECRRFPPTLMFQNYNETTGFPKTVAEDWCGEFNPKMSLVLADVYGYSTQELEHENRPGI